METINSCRICKSHEIKTFFDLGSQPLANSLLNSSDTNENVYPLSLSFCKYCALVQLNQTIKPEILFSNYIWVTGTAKTTVDYSEKFYKAVVDRLFGKKGRVLEVGSNDGTFLIPFKRAGFEVLGIDPAKNIVDLANKNGINTKCAFFGKNLTQDIVAKWGRADVVIARNVLPHVADIRGFVEGLSYCLGKDGILVIEVHYAKTILEELHYDSIYHEHLCYFTLKSLEYLLWDFGLYPYDLE